MPCQTCNSFTSQLDAAVERAPLGRRIGCLRRGLAISTCREAGCIDMKATDQGLLHGSGATTREIEIRSVVADAIRVAIDAQLPARVGNEDRRNLFQHRLGLLADSS